MDNSSSKKLRPAYLLLAIGLAIFPIVILWGAVSSAFGGEPLNPGPGYRDFSYYDADYILKAPTGEKAQSKLWWNDGYWWGSMYVAATNTFNIHRLQWGSQTWVDTGVVLDDLRNPLKPQMTKADTLWDAAANKLYVASSAYTKHGGPTSQANHARLMRYSYDAYNQTYTLDPEFAGPSYVTINEDRVEVLTIDKDSDQRLWTTYVSKRFANGTDYAVYVNASDGSDSVWGTPFTLPSPDVPLSATQVTSDDISTLVALQNHVAVVWSNQTETLSNTVHLALHNDSSAPLSGWDYYSMTIPFGSHVDDHFSAKSIAVSPNGQLFVALKMDSEVGSDPGIGMYAFNPNGTYSFHQYSTKTNRDTRPILVIDESANQVYLFVTGKDGGSKICYKTLSMPPVGDFPAGDCGIEFIEDDIYKDYNNPTSAKRNVNALTGLVVLAGDDKNGQYYGHNVMGNPPPVVDASTPARNAIDVPVNTGAVTVRFSKDMNPSTLNTANFVVKQGVTPLAGIVTYNPALKMATFTPILPFTYNTTYTVELSENIQDTLGTSLNEGIDTGPIRDTWSFSTSGPPVSFDNSGYTVNEGLEAQIMVVLENPSPEVITVDYRTVELPPEAVAPPAKPAKPGVVPAPGVDYIDITTTTLTFAPFETSKSFMVSTTPNTLKDGQRVLGVELLNPLKTVLAMPYTATLTIFDDETLTVRFQNALYAVDEGDGQATMEVILSPESTSQVKVLFSTQNGSATAGEDYTAVSNYEVVFAPGETSKTVPVPPITIIDDSLNEIDETVTLILHKPTTPADVIIANSPATLLIRDNDPQTAKVKFKSDNYSVDEGAGMVTLEVELTEVSGRDVTVNYETGGGTASPGIDYKPASGTVVIPKGVTVGSFTVDILDDTLPDEDETFFAGLSDADGAELVNPTNAVVTITGLDIPFVFLPVVIR